MKSSALLFSVGASLLALNASAAVNFVFTPVRHESQNDFESMTFDAGTGKYYQRPGFNADVPDVFEFDSYLSFETGTPSRTVSLERGYFGTYAAAYSGLLYGRSQLNPDFSGNEASRYNLGTGAIEHTVAFPNLAPVGNESLDWGGYTSMNFYFDTSGLFMLAKTDAAGDATWKLSKLDSDLNVLSSKTFVDSTLGFATMINGKLFTGAHDQILSGDLVTEGFDHAFDFASGSYDAFDVGFAHLGATQYLDNMVYDPTIDTMYVHNVQTRTFYKLGNVSKVLSGEIVTPIPDRTSGAACLAMVAAGLLVTSRSRSLRFARC